MRRLLETDPETGRVTWHEYDSLTGQTTLVTEEDVEPIIERNVAFQNSGWNGYTDKEKVFRYVGEIPNILIEKWLREEGIDVYNPDHWPAVKRKLNDIEFRKLRTSLWTV